MQTLTSSEKVYLGTDLVDVVFFSLILLYLLFTLNEGMKGNTFSLSYKEIAIMKAQRHLAPYKAGEGPRHL